MTHPRRYLFRMAVFLGIVVLVVASLFAGLEHAFTNNVGLNSVTLGVLLVGIVLNFRHVTMLESDVRWAESYRAGRPTDVVTSTSGPRLLAPLAAMVGERRDRFALSPAALRSLLDGLASRLDETREIARYLTGLMIFLGLLGTFWGLSQTVGSIGDVIRNLTISSDDVQSAFSGLKQGLDAPLAGMGTAFSTSLIGLSGSLILGFLDLQAGQAQNAFYNELEDWLSGQTKLTSSAGSSEGTDQPIPAYIQALLEQTADSLDNLQRVIARGEESRISANTNMRQLTDRLTILADQMKTEQSLMLKLAENQLEMKPILTRLADGASNASADEQTRLHIRNLDATLHRMVDEMATGRDEMVREIRSEFKLLARTIAALAEEEAQAPSSSMRLGRPDI
ncbi:flagellar motor protein MotA [Telmatospirillum sp.]|uniref:flagellar motor protein MotA n=1 Tax=Telmatospirillum sp. TaxID=2079197 RepID=UPI00283D5ACB|nr:flagellar motor protein MotA [Telmatospirillum sp.]MDR3437998.1 flagellar motor protein MotA [Telmatospirillum sp.]